MSSIIIHPANQSAPQLSIALQTRKSTDIPNGQITSINEQEIEQQMLKLKKNYLGITLRPNTISGIYNCHGMTFASRRTGINTVQWKHLIEDDYVTIKDSSVLPGDIVLYISEFGEIEHSGMVLSIGDNKQLSSIFVLSKWGDGSEVIHGLYICPYELSNIQFLRCEK